MLTRIIIGVIVLLTIFGFYYFKPNENVVLIFIKNHPEKSSIKLVRNDTTLAEINSDRMMPLASTVKIIVAIEYANQAAEGKIDADEKISISDLDKFYAPFTDGGAHPSWLNSVKEKIEDDKISIREIAKGMILYSSNANTEWLCEKLGMENINDRIGNLGLKNHDKMQYLVAALFVGKEISTQLKGEELATELRKLSPEDYSKIVNNVHEKLLTDKEYKSEVGDLSMSVQKVWSNNLPASTTNEYAALMKKINSKTYFTKETHEYLDEVMEYAMENPANQTWLKHLGMKGGSSAWVLTMSVYGTDLEGNRTELAYFFNELDLKQNMKLQKHMNQFLLKIMSDEHFRQKIKNELKN